MAPAFYRNRAHRAAQERSQLAPGLRSVALLVRHPVAWDRVRAVLAAGDPPDRRGRNLGACLCRAVHWRRLGSDVWTKNGPCLVMLVLACCLLEPECPLIVACLLSLSTPLALARLQVYARALEDGIDALLTRSRAEAGRCYCRMLQNSWLPCFTKLVFHQVCP